MAVNIRDFKPTGSALDLSDFITAVCICGGTTFKTFVTIDPETFEIASYYLDASCVECGTLLKLACPADLPD